LQALIAKSETPPTITAAMIGIKCTPNTRL
jgi:hypothetical protein